MQMEIYDARLLLEQLLGESRVQLQQQGFMVQLLPGATDAEIDQLEKKVDAYEKSKDHLCGLEEKVEALQEQVRTLNAGIERIEK